MMPGNGKIRDYHVTDHFLLALANRQTGQNSSQQGHAYSCLIELKADTRTSHEHMTPYRKQKKQGNLSLAIGKCYGQASLHAFSHTEHRPTWSHSSSSRHMIL